MVAVGANWRGACNVEAWTYSIQVAAGSSSCGGYTVGIESDATVVAVGENYFGQCDVGDWTDIIQVAAGESHMVGLKADGTVVIAGPEVELAKWRLF